MNKQISVLYDTQGIYSTLNEVGSETQEDVLINLERKSIMIENIYSIDIDISIPNYITDNVYKIQAFDDKHQQVIEFICIVLTNKTDKHQGLPWEIKNIKEYFKNLEE